MTNSVTVTESFGSTAQGYYLFAATGTLMDSTDIAIVTPVVQGTLDTSGNLSAVLLASDNFAPGALTWSCYVTVKGLSTIHVVDFTVAYGQGASQTLFAILSAAGWTPTQT